MKKVQVYHFHNGSGGGVLSVIRNLLRYRQSDQIENHVIYTINKDQNTQFDVPNIEGATSEQVFYFSSKWNFYHTCRQLAKLLPDDKAVIIAHDWLELGMCSNIGLKNPLIFVLHGAFSYYYDLAVKHSCHIDRYLCVSNRIKSDLNKELASKSHLINAILAPVEHMGLTISSFEKVSCIYFVNDLTDSRKQFLFLPKIDEFLELTANIQIQWLIAGGGMAHDEFYKFWNPDSHQRIHFHGKVNRAELVNILSKSNIMILPSLNEGLPISVIEAMLCGVVPIVGSWAKTSENYLLDQVNGFIADENVFQSFAYPIIDLVNDKNRLKLMSEAAQKSSSQLFNPEKNTKKIEDLILMTSNVTRVKTRMKTYGSRLDYPFVPNFITNSIRSFID